MLANYHLTNYYLNLFCIISSVIFIILEFKFLEWKLTVREKDLK